MFTWNFMNFLWKRIRRNSLRVIKKFLFTAFSSYKVCLHFIHLRTNPSCLEGISFLPRSIPFYYQSFAVPPIVSYLLETYTNHRSFFCCSLRLKVALAWIVMWSKVRGPNMFCSSSNLKFNSLIYTHSHTHDKIYDKRSFVFYEKEKNCSIILSIF
jgi:hypothetical protein